MFLEIKGIKKSFGAGESYVDVLKGIDLEIEKGEFCVLLGPSGSGKSTLMQHMNGLIRATDGHIYFNGEDIYDKDYDMKKLRSKVGLVFQYPEHQLFENDVISDVCFGPMNQGLSREQAEEEAKKALAHVGVKEENFTKSPFELSGGQKKRVAIAGVLAMNPKILILDEPTRGIDIGTKTEIQKIVLDLADQGMAVTFISSEVEEMLRTCSRMAVLRDGEKVGELEESELSQANIMKAIAGGDEK